jgi:Putative porin
MIVKIFRVYLTVILLVVCPVILIGQDIDAIRNVGNRFQTGGGAGSGDSLKFEKRNPLADSLTVRYRLMDTAKFRGPDSSIHDIFLRLPLNATSVWLGNNGNAERSIHFTPYIKPGFDAGFHAFDIYKFSLESTRFYTTTKPYSEIGYLIGPNAEQIINLLHTQNIRPNWNFAVQYRLINSPGFLKTQSTNHSTFRFSSNYQSKNKRYNLFLAVAGNTLQSSENGGIKSDTFLNNPNPAYRDQFNIPGISLIPHFGQVTDINHRK